MIPALWMVKETESATLTFGDGIVVGLLIIAAFVLSVAVIIGKRSIQKYIRKEDA